jgi:hypothetical protein
MHQPIHHKAAIAAALLVAAGLAGAQSGDDTAPSVPGRMNSTTSPNPLQVRPIDGEPNSAHGEQTPGTGTGSSRTMRNPTPASDSMVNGSPSTTAMPSADMKTERMATPAPMATPVPMATPAPMAAPVPMARPARRDRG